MASSKLWKTMGMLSAILVAATLATSAQTFTNMHSFSGSTGQNPYAPLIQATDGNFYGTTLYGGSNNNGTIFKITPWGSLSVLYRFTNHCDGSNPYAALLQASDGNFYGTTYNGGYSKLGTIFKLAVDGTMTCLHNFAGQSEGAHPVAALIQGRDGMLYGTTEEGGPWNKGTVFKISTTGEFTNLYSFRGLDGSGPESALIQGLDGRFYGTTWDGGLYDKGIVFRITSGGVLAKLHNFGASARDGAYPYAALVMDASGTLHGTTSEGGDYNKGTIFWVTPGGTLGIQHSINGSSDGATPYGSLVLASDGNFYGTTVWGGAQNRGTIFQLTPAGVFKTLHTFDYTNGAHPIGGLIQASNGSFYGTAAWGNSVNKGIVFGMSPTPQQYVWVNPCRLLDTRRSGKPFVGGTSQTLNLPQLARDSGCADLSSAQSYSLNVTMLPVNGQPVGFVTLWPAGKPMPVVSTMNAPDGRTKASAAIVPAGTNGAISLYLSNPADIIVDINGYFRPPSPSTLQFFPMTACRVIDTRGTEGPLGGPYLMGDHSRQFSMMQSQCFAGLNLRPQAYSLNVTAVPHQANHPLGYLTVWPGDMAKPNVSTLNNPTATAVANAAIVAAGRGVDGSINVYASDSTEFIVDVNGYFAETGADGLSLYSSMPCRAMDTRNNPGTPIENILAADMTHTVCTPPGAVGAYVLNATAVPVKPMEYLTLWTDGTDQPGVSTLNASDGAVTSNMAIVWNKNGVIDAFATGTTHLVLDLTGYFAP